MALFYNIVIWCLKQPILLILSSPSIWLFVTVSGNNEELLQTSLSPSLCKHGIFSCLVGKTCDADSHGLTFKSKQTEK